MRSIILALRRPRNPSLHLSWQLRRRWRTCGARLKEGVVQGGFLALTSTRSAPSGIKGQILRRISRTPQAAEFVGHSGLGSLPLDLLVDSSATCVNNETNQPNPTLVLEACFSNDTSSLGSPIEKIGDALGSFIFVPCGVMKQRMQVEGT